MEVQKKWEQLSEERRERLIEKHRDGEVQFEWWDFTYEGFVERMGEIGVRTSAEEIYFSGFWSQGDGACFGGSVNDWEKFLTAAGKPELIDFAREHDLHLYWQSSGRYSHENSVDFSTEYLWSDNPHDEDDDPMRHAAWAAIHPGEGGPVYAASDDFEVFLRGKMRDLYSQLEEEHDYLTSDEAVTEYILANREDEIDEALEEQAIEEEEVI